MELVGTQLQTGAVGNLNLFHLPHPNDAREPKLLCDVAQPPPGILSVNTIFGSGVGENWP